MTNRRSSQRVELGAQLSAAGPRRGAKSSRLNGGDTREVVACVAAKAVGGMRFHDLRHAYATWLVADGVPVNLVQRVMGHEQASTTLDRHTHTPADYAARILDAFTLPADDLLTPAAEPPAESLSDGVGELP